MTTSENPAPLRVLVADDEALARRRLLRLLQAIPGVQACGECTDGAEVIARVREGGVDVVLLDIQMPGLSGWDALGLMPDPKEGPYIIFCTAHPDHAVRAFDAGAVDYLLKPIEAARLQKALERARARETFRRLQAEPPRAKETPALQRLAISTQKGIVLLDPDDISHALLDGELVRVCAGQGEYLTDATLAELADRLPKDRFMRVHRRALLNLQLIARLEPVDSGGFIARTRRGDGVEVSRQAARELRRWLGLRRGADDA